MISIIGMVLSNRWLLIPASLLAGYLYGFASVPRVDIDAIRKDAIASAEARFVEKMRIAEKQDRKKVRHAVQNSYAIVPLPASPDARVQVCARDANCRKSR